MARPDSAYLARAIRTTLREATWSATCRHEQGSKPNILLFASRRGGSTFAMELIAANRGIRPLNQPLETLSRNITMAQALDIPGFRQGQMTSLYPGEAEQLRVLVEGIFAGKIVINAPTRFWRRDVDRVSHRLVLKLTDCKAMIGWFDTNTTADIVYLTRHPIPQSLSCLRNGWTLTVDAHLGDPSFVAANVPERALAMAHETMASGSPLRQFVLNWVLENAAPLRLLPDRAHWLHLRYEDCVVEPHRVFETMAARLGLDDVDRMRDVLVRPSQSSRRSTGAMRDSISAGLAADSVERWRSEVDDDDVRWTTELFEAFELDAAPAVGGA